MKKLILLTLVLSLPLSAQDDLENVIEEVGEIIEDAAEEIEKELEEMHDDDGEYHSASEWDDGNQWEPEGRTVTDEIIFYKDHVIPRGTISYDNIRIIGGDLIVDGTVKGKITLIGGDVKLNDTAVLDGQIVVVGGNVQKHANAVINGKIIESNNYLLTLCMPFLGRGGISLRHVSKVREKIY